MTIETQSTWMRENYIRLRIKALVKYRDKCQQDAIKYRAEADEWLAAERQDIHDSLLGVAEALEDDAIATDEQICRLENN